MKYLLLVLLLASAQLSATLPDEDKVKVTAAYKLKQVATKVFTKENAAKVKTLVKRNPMFQLLKKLATDKSK